MVMMVEVVLMVVVVMVGATLLYLCFCLFSLLHPQNVMKSLEQELCPSFLLPSAPGENHGRYSSGILSSNIFISQVKDAGPEEERLSACLPYILGGEIRDIYKRLDEH